MRRRSDCEEHTSGNREPPSAGAAVDPSEARLAAPVLDKPFRITLLTAGLKPFQQLLECVVSADETSLPLRLTC